ncbi:SH3 domain-containing protein [Dichotomicrobium thermohalophilum]|uniref:ClpP protease-like protein n=1 Tax=Dichotomicrobium thermohalophilum TaxID=933063 RepID=A0A397Q556_9HYPH|nr:SH3 domain-containing protein [Dichotomicrobium thermohalophilum]RIA56083.1 ClpP protease-like protein [Dichotomicrobium thermohalophilum]
MRDRLGHIGLWVLRAVLAAIFISAPVHVAQAAFIEKKPLGPESPDLIMVFGELETRDIERFRDVASNTPEAIVALAGPGGSVAAGIEIGHMIRLRNYKTVVFGDQQCASSCALAWLGGAPRFMAESARIGFHAASDGRSGQVSGAGNALVGAYLNRIGLQASAIVYITQAGPDGMIWLSPAEAKRYGIEVQTLESQERTRSDNGAFGLSAPAGFGRGGSQFVTDYRVVRDPKDGWLNLRTGPSTDFNIIRRMDNGTRVRILELYGEWALVRHESGSVGWAYLPYMAKR